MTVGRNEGFPTVRPKELFELSGDETQQILDKTVIKGGRINGQELTKDLLIANNLLPRFSVDVSDKRIALSSPFVVDGRLAVIGFVEQENAIVARAYYQSNSHGTWRYLPYYFRDADREEESYVWGKGYSEDSITLPFQMQKALSYIADKNKPLTLKDNPMLFDLGTTYELPEVFNDGFLRPYELKAFIPPNIELSYAMEVQTPARININGNSYSSPGLAPPDRIQFRYSVSSSQTEEFRSIDQSPDFTQPLDTWMQYMPLYGRVTVEVFPSANKELVYLFNTDDKGRVWISNIQYLHGQISSTGLAKNSIDGGALTTPAYEYEAQAYGYGNPDLKNGDYVDMFTNYTSKIPIITKYLSRKKV